MSEPTAGPADDLTTADAPGTAAPSGSEPTPEPETEADPLHDTAGAVEEVLRAAAAQTEPLDLGILTDEELYALSATPEEAAPTGLFFQGLSPEQQQAAALGAMRALTSRGELDSEVDAEGVGDVALPTPYVAALALRRRDPHLSLRVVGFVGETWYILRHVRDDLFLREVVTSHGFHLVSVVRLDEDERETFVAQLVLPEGAEEVPAPAVKVSVSQAQLEGAEIGTSSALAFLEETRIIANLIRTPAVDGISSSMINVQPDGGLVIGDIDRGRVSYHGETVARLRADWDRWATLFADAVAQSEADEDEQDEQGEDAPEAPAAPPSAPTQE